MDSLVTGAGLTLDVRNIHQENDKFCLIFIIKSNILFRNYILIFHQSNSVRIHTQNERLLKKNRQYLVS